MRVPSGMQVGQDILKQHGINQTKELESIVKEVAIWAEAGWKAMEQAIELEVVRSGFQALYKRYVSVH